MKRIYLDHAATAPLHPEAFEAMRPWLCNEFGNPSSLHEEGQKARRAIDAARETISALLGCQFGEVVFTSSGTEAANLAIAGCALAHREGGRKRILMSQGEHHCVLHTAPFLRSIGFSVEELPIDRFARLNLDELKGNLGDDVLLLAAMHANNELGAIQPVREVASLCRAHGALYFCDAVQTFGAVPWTVPDLDADLVAVSSHKVSGPKGVGALFVRAGTRVQPISFGGGQEREVRAGTENVAGIVGFATAARLLSLMDRKAQREARDAFFEALGDSRPLRTVPADVECLGGHAHIRFSGISAESVLIRLDRMGVSASSGAACSSGSLEPSHVLLAAGYSKQEASEGLRFTFGVNSTVEEARDAARRVKAAVESIAGA